MRVSKYAGRGGGAREGSCFQGNQSSCRYASRLASVTFKMASKVFVEETDQKFEFFTDILFRFLKFGMLTLGRITPSPHKVFLSFFLKNKTSVPDVFSSCSFIPHAHFETSLVIVSCYGYDL